MSNFEIDVDYDDRQIQAAFQSLIQSGDDLEPVFKSIGEYLLKEHEARWEDGVSLVGFAWPELTEKTWEKKRKNNEALPLFGNPAEMLTRAAFNTTADALELVIPSDIAVHHHFGAPKNNLPARELLGISQRDEKVILDKLQDFIMDAWED